MSSKILKYSKAVITVNGKPLEGVICDDVSITVVPGHSYAPKILDRKYIQGICMDCYDGHYPQEDGWIRCMLCDSTFLQGTVTGTLKENK